MKLISSMALPFMIGLIIFFGLLRGVKIYDVFLEGAGEGLRTALKITAPLVALISAISMLRASGALELICHGLSPLASFLSFPKDALPLAILRPISGSASLAILKDILNESGPDSFTGRVASVISGSTETTFYTLAVYFGSVGIKNTRHTLRSALIGDITGTILGAIIVRMLL